MKLLLFGATGMVGQGVLRECLLDSSVESVLAVTRTGTGVQHPKLREVLHKDFLNYSDIETRLSGFDACFFCLGVSSAGKSEEEYTRVTYGITTAAGTLLCRLNPQMIFVYVSGAGTDGSEHGRAMWARVKGRTENALLRMPFAAAYMFRPGVIQPLHGVRSRTPLYRIFYALLNPFFPLLRLAFPNHVLTTEQIGRAMLTIVKESNTKHVLENRVLESKDIRALAQA